MNLNLVDNNATISLTGAEDDNVFITSSNMQCSGVRINIRNGKLNLSCDFVAIDKINGGYLERVLSERICQTIRNAPIEWLISEGSIQTLIDIARLFGGQISELSDTAKQNLWHKLFNDGRAHPVIFSDPLEQKKFDCVSEICEQSVKETGQ